MSDKYRGKQLYRQKDETAVMNNEKWGGKMADHNEKFVKKNRRIAMVLMASGFGQRYGGNKLLEDFQGRPLFAHAFARAVESGADSICVVTRYPEIKDYVEKWREEETKKNVRKEGFSEAGKFTFPVLSPERIRVIWNPHPERGISESLRLGLEAQRDADGCCFMVCDQPLLTAATLQRMFEAFCKSPNQIFVCTNGSRRGNPVLFPKSLFGELLELTGDSGGKQIMRRYPQRVREIMTENAKELFDVDFAQDLSVLFCKGQQ